MADNAGPFEKADDLSDLVLLVDGGELYVHKLMLMLHSPVFKRMLSSDFAEKDAKQLTLPGKKREDLVEFLKQIYAMYSCNAINDDNVMGVLSLADEYQVDHVTAKCRKFIEQQSDKLGSPSVDQVLLYLGLSDRYHFDDVKSMLVQRVKDVVSAKAAAQSPFYNMVDVTLMRDIMQSKAVEKSSQERPVYYHTHRSVTSSGPDKSVRLTRENEQLKSTVASLELRLRPLEDHKCSLFSLACQEDYRKRLLLILVIVGAIFILFLAYKICVYLFTDAEVKCDCVSVDSSAKDLTEL